MPCFIATIAQECSPESMGDYNMSLRIGSIFIILITSAIGTFTPLLIHRARKYEQNSFQDWVLLIAKFFGTGVILATAFIHMLPDAMNNFGSPCLDPEWQTYGSWAGIFCMIASFALQLLELAAVSNSSRLKLQQSQSTKEEYDCEAPPTPTTPTTPTNPKNNFSEPPVDTRSIGSTTTTTPTQHPHPPHHVHSAGFLETHNAYKDINTIILELGIVMHSVIIGITLANTGADEFLSLLIALVFHQFFEGIALGTRVNGMHGDGWARPVIMGLFYIIMTPLGIGIGIGIHSSFNPNSPTSILASAILDSLSAGILLYNAYVSLMSLEINHSPEFQQYSITRKLICFLSMYIGAAIMSLIGKWS
ncbi:ZIP zinc/iron transport family [Hesseltinella vesiculosa]|uniref:ZIP zinc/iron transport family n=1 Tax=Hesseltinella vesiculosa TaxID=101127 RepID=A0A1X2GUK2_9FUNG|nr:ZIP zinc/iron transport family [Hesseltinella vesiculosa]